jgi:hypothetical protein
MAVDARWHRWVYASIAKHLHAIATTASIDLVVEFLDERTAAWQSASPRAEVIITGPMSKEISKGLHRVWVDVFITLTSDRSSNDYIHIGHSGTLANALDQCILVRDYGDTGVLDVSVLNPIRDLGRTVAVQHVRPSEKDATIHSTIQSRFYGLFAEN